MATVIVTMSVTAATVLGKRKRKGNSLDVIHSAVCVRSYLIDSSSHIYGVKDTAVSVNR